MHDLLRFRLDAMDQRLATAGTALIAALSSLSSLPADAEGVLLLAIPVAVTWLGRITIVHARSKEDLKRRIDQIERQINTMARQKLLRFHSGHSDRLGHVAGRTGTTTAYAVVALSLTMFGACSHLLGTARKPWLSPYVYHAFVAASGLYLVFLAWDLRSYRRAKKRTRHISAKSHS